MPLVRRRVVRLFNCLLEGELVAAECYKRAAHAVKDTELARHLHELECSHRMRVLSLRERLHELGIAEVECAGLALTGSFVKMAAAIALLLGLNLGLLALACIERYGRHRYKMLTPMLTQSEREFVETSIGQEQKQCCEEAERLLASRQQPDWKPSTIARAPRAA